MRYKKRREYIDAVQWTGNNKHECINFLGISFYEFRDNETKIIFDSKNGDWIACIGDYIIREDDDFFVYKPDMFEREYMADSALDSDAIQENRKMYLKLNSKDTT